MGLLPMLSLFLVASLIGFRLTRSPASQPAPLIAATCAIGGVIITAPLIGAAETSDTLANYLGLAAIALASAAISGGFIVVGRMLAADRREDRE